jgi:hypothetical protein
MPTHNAPARNSRRQPFTYETLRRLAFSDWRDAGRATRVLFRYKAATPRHHFLRALADAAHHAILSSADRERIAVEILNASDDDLLRAMTPAEIETREALPERIAGYRADTGPIGALYLDRADVIADEWTAPNRETVARSRTILRIEDGKRWLLGFPVAP